MKPDQQRLLGYLQHVVEAIERIDSYTANMSELAFLDDALVQDAVIRNIEIVGEASHRIETMFPDFAEANSYLPLSAAYQMRKAVTHGYFKVDFEIVWKTIQSDLPHLHAQVKHLIADM